MESSDYAGKKKKENNQGRDSLKTYTWHPCPDFFIFLNLE
jgi:hypothetical protein